MAQSAARTFSAAMADAPVNRFQWMTVAICLLILVSDGIDLQLLGIVAPLVIADFGVDRSIFGLAMSAALVGYGLGAWGGGVIGDRFGRRYALAIASAIFSLATIGASQAGGVTSMAVWRLIGGLGFGAAYANALTMAGEWLPERLRPLVVSTISVGTPIGGTVVGWLGPTLAEKYGWHGAFVIFGSATLLLIAVIMLTLRDSPSFLLARGRKEEAQLAARRVLDQDVVLVAERHGDAGETGPATRVLHRSNLRLNLGIGIAFTACAVVAYGILNWTTTFLTAAGFTLGQAGNAVSVAGITSVVACIAAGLLCRHYGSKWVMSAISLVLFLLLILLCIAVENLSAAPTPAERLTVVSLVGATAALFSGGIATMYVMMTDGYPPACRSAGIGFGIFMSRVGAVSASGFGGTLLDWGHGSVVPFFAVLATAALLISAAAFVVDRHIPPASKA